MVAGFDCRGCAGWFALVATSPPTDLKDWQLPLTAASREIINPNHATHQFNVL
jgi:hypothetical protein